MSSATTNLSIVLNSVDDANRAVVFIKDVVAERTPDYPNELDKFIADIVVDGNTVKVEESYSLMSNTFCELVPQIIRRIAKNDFGAFTAEAWYTSFNSDYEAEFSAKVFKNGKLKINFSEHDF